MRRTRYYILVNANRPFAPAPAAPLTSFMDDFLWFSSSFSGVPRTEATQIVGSLLAFPPILQNIPLLLPNPNELSLISSADVKDQIVGVLLKSGKKEPAGLARCISLSSLGLFVYNELLNESLHGKIKEAIQVPMKQIWA